MKTRIVHTKVWQDEWFSSLPRHSKLLFIYLLTCPQNNLTSTFELPDRVVLFDTGLNQSELNQAKEELRERVIFYKSWIRLLQSTKYNNYISNTKMETARKNELALIPEEILEYMDGYDTSIHTSIYTPNNHKSKIINNKSKIINRESVTEEYMTEVADKYQVPLSFVISKFEDVCNWEDEKPGRMRGRNWKLTLVNWVKRDAIKIKGRHKCKEKHRRKKHQVTGGCL